MNQYIIDTNILIHILVSYLPEKSHDCIKDICARSFCVSIISKIELLGYRGETPDGLSIAREFLQNADIIPLSDSISEITINLMQNHSIRLPDAVIAASAFYLNAILVTRNVKDFIGIEGISIFNPFDSRG